MRRIIITLALAWGASAGAVEIARTGWGAVVGWPFGVRYQRALGWKQAAFYDLGYQTDEFVMVGANLSRYFLTEDDRWKVGEKTGRIFYSGFLGGTAGYRVGTSDGERSRLGLRAGGAFEYSFPDPDWALRAEVAPVLFLTGTSAAGLQGGIVLMKYFGNRSKRQPKLKRPSQKGRSAD